MLTAIATRVPISKKEAASEEAASLFFLKDCIK